MRALPFVLMLCAAACTADDPVIDHTFDVCEPLGLEPSTATAEEWTGVTDALALWRARGLTTIAAAPIDGAPTIPIVFQTANPTFHGSYDDEVGVIYVNRDLDASPEARAVTIAHELGHAFGLLHVALDERASVMNPHNLTVSPTEEDARQVELLWGKCPVRARSAVD